MVPCDVLRIGASIAVSAIACVVHGKEEAGDWEVSVSPASVSDRENVRVSLGYR